MGEMIIAALGICGLSAIGTYMLGIWRFPRFMKRANVINNE